MHGGTKGPLKPQLKIISTESLPPFTDYFLVHRRKYLEACWAFWEH